MSIAQDRDPVCDLEDLLQSVGDEDQRNPLLLQSSHHLEEHYRLSLAQGRGGLIHRDQVGVERQCLGDLDHLPLGNAQALHQRAGIDLHVQAIKELLSIPIKR